MDGPFMDGPFMDSARQPHRTYVRTSYRPPGRLASVPWPPAPPLTGVRGPGPYRKDVHDRRPCPLRAPRARPVRRDQAFPLMGAEYAAPPGSEAGGPSPHDHENDRFEASWKSFWSATRSWKRDVTLRGSRHMTFTTSAPVHQQLAAGVGVAPERIAALFGAAPADRSVLAQRAYITAFFGRHLRGDDDRGLLDGPSPHFPDVVFVP
ncbi:hydrolase (plasmid) [Streptomyces clavuligerus]|uniref:Putative hydrolase n=3 Tax=Streptomyces clavuligerus TaxID=1901 RepID=D5SLF2_STRCL|nr:hydrolase [Streptomyces clavuligerus]EFG04745.1 Putative hydrolase [Streptomyces clavuligerus]QCS10591.1 hydrolase [Streptomyces clavuligerus]